MHDSDLEPLASMLAGLSAEQWNWLALRVRFLRDSKAEAVPRTEDEQRAFALAWNDRVDAARRS